MLLSQLPEIVCVLDKLQKNPGNQRNGESPSGKTESLGKVHSRRRRDCNLRTPELLKTTPPPPADDNGYGAQNTSTASNPILPMNARMEWMHNSRPSSSPNRNALRHRAAHPKIASEFTGEAQCNAIRGIDRRPREQRDREGLARFWGPRRAERRIRTSITDRRHRLFSCLGTSELPSV